jgi:hypothetical protein
MSRRRQQREAKRAMNKYASEAGRTFHKERSCERKKRFANQNDAYYMLPENQRVYRCEFCDGWHRHTAKFD